MICPATQIEITGCCPVKSCPAHTARVKSGCIYDDLNEVSMYSIGSRFKLNNTQIKKDYRKGLKILTNCAKFYHLALQLYVSPLKTCSRCGIAGLDCLNLIKCKKRQVLAEKYIKRLPMRVLVHPSKPIFWQSIVNPQLHEFFRKSVIHKAFILLGKTND